MIASPPPSTSPATALQVLETVATAFNPGYLSALYSDKMTFWLPHAEPY